VDCEPPTAVYVRFIAGIIYILLRKYKTQTLAGTKRHINTSFHRASPVVGPGTTAPKVILELRSLCARGVRDGSRLPNDVR